MSPSIPCALNPTDDPAPTPVGYPAVTLSDLASFRPTPLTMTAEPEGIGVVGLPVNLVAPASAQTLRGTLFAFPVSVSFTPESYAFDYGDGHAQTTSTGGTTWTALGAPQFTPTATSHTYTARGTYSASVTVSYIPAVQFDDGIWRRVDGYVTSTASAAIQIFEASTVLVAHTCAENPAGPGC